MTRTAALLPPPAGEQRIPVFAAWLGSWQVSLHRRPMSVPELVQRYDRAAGNWARTIARLDVPRAYETLLANAIHDAGVQTGPASLHALDCGIGSGALSCALAQVVPGAVQLNGIDLSPAMLDEADRHLKHRGLDADLRCADVGALPYDDGTFDIVMAAHLLDHLPDPAAALAEMHRVVRPGGHVIVCLTRRTLLGFYIHLKWHTHMVQPDDAETWLKDCGLVDVGRLATGDGRAFQRLSIACIGRKPDAVG